MKKVTVAAFYYCLCLLSFLFAAYLLCKDVYVLARSGEWTPVRFNDILAGIGINTWSIYNPRDWIGIAKIGQWILDSYAWFVMGCISFIMGAVALDDKADEKRIASSPGEQE